MASTVHRALGFVTSLCCLPPAGVGVLSLVDRDRVLGMFQVAPTADTRVMALLFGLAVLNVGAVGGLAVVWILAERREGVVLAGMLGASALVAGLAMTVLGLPQFGVLDIVKGGLLALMAVFVARRTNAAMVSAAR